MISLTQVLMQQGYITEEQYSYAYQIQQLQPIELRKPLAMIYMEQGFLGMEHIQYCLGLKQEYLTNGIPEDMSNLQQQPQYNDQQQGGGNYEAQAQQESIINCKVCLSECNASWAMCPFCGNSLK